LIPRADTHIPVNRNRKKAGVGETFTFSVVPASAAATNWRIETNDTTNVLTVGSKIVALQCSIRASQPKIKADAMGVTLVCEMDVIEPTGLSARKTGGTGSIYPNLKVGDHGVGMSLAIRALPADVSFGNLEALEIDMGTVNVNGFFTNLAGSVLNHHPAIAWAPLDILNEWTDRAGYEGVIPPPAFDTGTFDWNIEVRWRVEKRESGNGKVLTNIVQKHSMDDIFGKSTVTKLGQTETRSPNDPP